jgi:coenzyme F420 hydrogenase subunit beta
MAKRLSSQKLLKNNVLDTQLCTGCGACVGLCPYQAIYNDRTVQLHYCDLTEGKCHVYCPRTPTDFESLRQLLFDAKDLTPEIGAVKAYYLTRAVDPEIREAGQHGGSVTALMELALAEGLIHAALVSSGNDQYLRYGTLAADKNTIRKSAGVKFIVSPMAAAFNQFVREYQGRAGVVATPCQALALAKMKLNRDKDETGKIKQLQLVIGLYCGWALSVEKFSALLAQKSIRIDDIKRMDIPAGKNILELYTAQGVKEIPLEEAQACVREACNYCIDSTAEYADISVGAARFGGTVDEQRGWNQLIVRSQRGKDLIDLAVKRGVLEIKEAPAESLRQLKVAAMEKKKSALKNIARKSGSAKKLLYLDNRDVLVRRILGV